MSCPWASLKGRRTDSLSTNKPATTATTNKMPIKTKASLGIMASMTKASSPDEAIIMATNAPKVSSLCEYIDTAAKPPIQPGIRPKPAPKTTCPMRFCRSLVNHFPCEWMLMYSIINIIIITKPVIKTLFLSTSKNKCENSCMTHILSSKDKKFCFPKTKPPIVGLIFWLLRLLQC